MLRAISLIGALIGGLGLSQFPAFSQQYVQRLGGAVDELSRIVTRFDASAQSARLSREEALAELSGSAFLDEQRAAITADIARHERLQTHLEALQTASPLQQLTMPHRFSDADLLAATWRSYQPGLQLTLPSALMVLIGLGAGGLGLRGLGWLVLRLWRRMRGGRDAAPSTDQTTR